MKNVTKFLSFAAVAVALSACACPRYTDYGDTPYDTRTAGQGVYVYGQCDVEKRQTTSVRSAEPVMQQRARK